MLRSVLAPRQREAVRESDEKVRERAQPDERVLAEPPYVLVQTKKYGKTSVTLRLFEV